tara:strand:- start:91 stop:1293 length:1203 start_codon:yes stop_codon:yes gene_type:complete
MIIKSISAKAIKDSRNKPTIEVTVNNSRASAPSGKSTGKYETKPYNKSLAHSIRQINSINSSELPNISSFNDLKKLESFLKKKFKLKDPKDLGANTLFAFQAALLKALAKSNGKELWQVINPKAKRMPTPLGNAIGGGLHSSNSQKPTFQEFLIVPRGKTFQEKYNLMKSTYRKLGKVLGSKKVNDEGAWQTNLSETEILELLSTFKDIKIGLDIAASSFYMSRTLKDSSSRSRSRTKSKRKVLDENGRYKYKGKSYSRKEQIFLMNNLISSYNIFYLEDPLEENDFSGFGKINSSNTLVCADDLTATHLSRVKKAKGKINAMIVKPNQNGSLIELAEILSYCKKNKIKTILSHRSRETLDDTISDLAFAFQTDFIKTGIATPYREAKLRRLLKIEKSKI